MVGSWASCLISASFKTPGGCESQHLSALPKANILSPWGILGAPGLRRCADLSQRTSQSGAGGLHWATGQYMQDAMCSMSCWWHFGVFRCAGIQVYRFANGSPSTRLLFCVYLCTHVEARGQAGPLALSPT